MILAFALLAEVGSIMVDGPDLAEVEHAVDKCDSKTMTKIFSAEPQRRRAAVIAVFKEQRAIVEAKRALAQRRRDPLIKPADGKNGKENGGSEDTGSASGPVLPPPTAASLDAEAQIITDRQQALDDARMLASMREDALDMMRKQYLATCNTEFAHADK